MKSLISLSLTALSVIVIVGPSYGAAESTPLPDDPVIEAMRLEMDRSMDKLKIGDFDGPYFVMYTVIEWEEVSLLSRAGALYYESANRRNNLDAEIRVGDYSFDSSVHNFNELYANEIGAAPPNDAPIDYNTDAIRYGLWLMTDAAYKNAVGTYQSKKLQRAVGAPKSKPLPDFYKAPKLVYVDPPPPMNLDKKKWIKILNEESAYLADFDRFQQSALSLRATRYVQRQTNTEGSAAIIGGTYYEISAWVNGLADDGTPLYDFEMIKGRSIDQLPDQAEIHRGLVKLTERAKKMFDAEVLTPYTGPAILSPIVSGILFHEAIGHRLEGLRQRSEDEGQTFKDEVGKQILPDFLSVIDDPTAKKFGDAELFGAYPVDDQLVRAQKVTLVEDGVLRNFLVGRRPIAGFDASNGHARGAGPLGPTGRMSNLMIKSKNEKSRDELKRLLIEEVKRQGKPFGVIIETATGGETNTKRQGFFGEGQTQAFRVPVIRAYKVDTETGEETLIRGIDLIGTPLVSINKIIATGSDYQTENGYCGAESGTQPVSQTAPSILTSEIELQRSATQKRSKPILPPPQ